MLRRRTALIKCPGCSTQLALASFTASRMGKNVAGVTLNPAAIQSVGLNLGLVDMCAGAP